MKKGTRIVLACLNHLYEVTNETFNTKAFGPLGKEMLLDEIGGMLLKKQ